MIRASSSRVTSSSGVGRRGSGPIIAAVTLDGLHINVRSEDGAFWATVEEFPGVFATGDDVDELRESLREGVALVAGDVGE
jgi:predicted RNase H-like HicB family nuclease